MCNEKAPYHVTISVNNFHVYRVFNTCEALCNYIRAILKKGYNAFWYDYNAKEEWTKHRTSDIDTLCSSIYDFGISFQKGDKKIFMSETAKSSKNTGKSSKKAASKKPKTTLSEPVYF